MGVTYVAVAAEHPLVHQRRAGQHGARRLHLECRQGGVSEAEIETMEKKGHPGPGCHPPRYRGAVPIYAANFVLLGYGDRGGHGRARP